MDTVTLYQEFRLIEKSENDINGAWKGAHLLLFFLTFVFGSFCTFCFHVLIYLFDEKCVLYPKLLSIKDLRRGSATGLIFDYIATKDVETLPVDFVTTQWMDSSVCYLPTYVPLLSGICGLIWTTMFLMCSSGSRALTGLQRPWRILPTVFVFSLAMGGLCVYTSVITHNGLQQLCTKLGEVTGSSSCTYTINVATLAYERRIRGVYQATRLTILSAWMHTTCWLGAALLALIRVLLVVDFRLVRVRADLQGNIEKMLERHEKHIRTDEFWVKDDYTNTRSTLPGTSTKSTRFYFSPFEDLEDHKAYEYISDLLEEVLEHVEIYVTLKRLSSVSKSTAKLYSKERYGLKHDTDEQGDVETREIYKRNEYDEDTDEENKSLKSVTSEMSLTPEMQKYMERKERLRRSLNPTPTRGVETLSLISSTATLVPTKVTPKPTVESKPTLRPSQLMLPSEKRLEYQTSFEQKVRFDQDSKKRPELAKKVEDDDAKVGTSRTDDSKKTEPHPKEKQD